MVIEVTNQSSAPRKTRKELLSEWRHGEVLQAARRLFARLGYSAANVEDIAKEAGMAKGTIYLYFKSKEEVFAAVLARDLECLTDKTIEGMSAAEGFAERLTVFLNLRLVYLQHNQDFMRVYRIRKSNYIGISAQGKSARFSDWLTRRRALVASPAEPADQPSPAIWRRDNRAAEA